MFQSAYWQQNCKVHCDSMLGSLSSLVELVKIFILLSSADSTQNKLDLHKVSILVCVEVFKVCWKIVFCDNHVAVNNNYWALIVPQFFYRARIQCV